MIRRQIQTKSHCTGYWLLHLLRRLEQKAWRARATYVLMGRGERDHSDKEGQQKGNKKQRSTYKVHVPEEAIKAHHVQVQGATTPSLSGHVAHSSTVCEQMAKVRWVQPEAIKANNVTPIPLSARRDIIRSPRPREVVGELLDLAQFTGYDCGSRSQDLEKSIDPTPSSFMPDQSPDYP